MERVAEAEIRFRNFHLLPGSRVLFRDGVCVELGSRAFDLLHVLAGARGSVVDKDVIAGRVWPTTVVDESNIRYQIAVLRKALGRDRDLIKTIAGRGYLFVAESMGAQAGGPAGSQTHRSLAPPQSSLTGQLARLWPEAGQDGRPIPSRLAESLEACEALSRLLRATLEDIWEASPSRALDANSGPYAAHGNSAG